MITIAPELPGAIEAIELMVDAGVIAAVGHTDADFVTTKRAIDAGANVATHLSNAMRPLHHREPAAIGALLEDPRVAVEVIADGTHVHPAVLRILFREAGDERVCLITDAMAAAGADDGHYRLGKLNVEVVDGVARLEETGAIAGSSLTMDGALRYLSLEHGTALERLCVRLSTNPARVLGLDDRGTIAAGQRADLVVIDHYLQVQTVIRRGEVVSGAW